MSEMKKKTPRDSQEEKVLHALRECQHSIKVDEVNHTIRVRGTPEQLENIYLSFQAWLETAMPELKDFAHSDERPENRGIIAVRYVPDGEQSRIHLHRDTQETEAGKTSNELEIRFGLRSPALNEDEAALPAEMLRQAATALATHKIDFPGCARFGSGKGLTA